MLFFVCALHCEAEALISHFKLKYIGERGRFPLYRNDSIVLIISGIGKINSAAAVSFLQALFSEEPFSIWLNVGIAGHRHFEIGSGYLAHQVLDKEANTSFYPSFVFKLPCLSASLLSVNQPEKMFESDHIFEMEASGFYQTALRFSSAEFIHCFKVISDNQKESMHQIHSSKVPIWMENHLPLLETLTHSLFHLSKETQKLDQLPQEYTQILNQWHFTQTQQHQLKRIIQGWNSCSQQPIMDDQAWKMSHSKPLLSYLQKKLHEQPLIF